MSPKTEEQLKEMQKVLDGEVTLESGKGPSSETGKPINTDQNIQQKSSDEGDSVQSDTPSIQLPIQNSESGDEGVTQKNLDGSDIDSKIETTKDKEADTLGEQNTSKTEKDDSLPSTSEDKGEDGESLNNLRSKGDEAGTSDTSQSVDGNGEGTDEQGECRPCNKKEKDDKKMDGSKEGLDSDENGGEDGEPEKTSSEEGQPSLGASVEQTQKESGPEDLNKSGSTNPESKGLENGKNSLIKDSHDESEDHGRDGVLDDATGGSDLNRKEQIDKLQGLSDELTSLIDQLQVKFSL